MTSAEIRQKFLEFFQSQGHTIVPSSSLIPDDPSVLLTSAGMQQFKLYFLGEPSPWGPNVVSVQKCFRTSDIDEVGDERHLTFFEMLGNFSFGGYGKKEAIEYAHKFITQGLGLTIDYVTVFEGEGAVPMDEESVKIWQTIDSNLEIKKFGRADNFWGPTGTEGPCGPTTEIYVKGIEIWNLVFNQYYQKPDGSLEPLKVFGIDTGMGLERLAMVVRKKKNVFKTDLFKPLIDKLDDFSPNGSSRAKRIIADHVRAATFLIADGIIPGKEGRDYILRRLIRRAVVHAYLLGLHSFGPQKNQPISLFVFADIVIKEYSKVEQYKYLENSCGQIIKVLDEEEKKFRNTLIQGLKEIHKTLFGKVSKPLMLSMLSHTPLQPEDLIGRKSMEIKGSEIFHIVSTYGFPLELCLEEFSRAHNELFNRPKIENFDIRTTPLGKKLLKEYEEAFKEHQGISRVGMEKKFAGGLADHEPATIKLHTAHHLLLAALQQVLGPSVKQRGSNITQERLRLDFSWGEKLTDEQKKQVEDLVNEKIKANLPVIKKEMSREEAEQLGAEHEFGQKYGERVSVYFIGDPSTSSGRAFSTEFCGGPHVTSTGELGTLKISKEEAVAQGIRRIRAVLV